MNIHPPINALVTALFPDPLTAYLIIVLWKYNPETEISFPNQRCTIRTRDLRPSNRDAMRVYLQQVGIDAHIDALDTCARKASALESIVQVRMELIMPLQSKTIYSGEPSWINATLKDLIRRRQRALAPGSFSELRLLRNRMNRER